MTDLAGRIQAAEEELRRRRSLGEDLDHALDSMRGKGYTLPAIVEALVDVEGLSHLEVKQLFDRRGDWDDF